MKLTPHCGSAVHHPSLIHKSGSIQHSKTVQFPKLFSHSFPCFFVGPSPSITDKDCEKTYWVKLTPHCKVQNLFSATRQSKFQNSFHTFLFCFLSDRLLAYQIKTKNDTLWVKATPLLISNLSPSLVHKSRSIKEVDVVGGSALMVPQFFFFAFQGGCFSIASFSKGSEIPAKKI